MIKFRHRLASLSYRVSVQVTDRPLVHTFLSRLGAGWIYEKITESDRPEELSLSVRDNQVSVPLDFDDPDELPSAHPANWFFPRCADGTPHEPMVSGLLADSLDKGDVFIDCGAHIGYFSALAATQVGKSGTLISIEPAKERHNYINEIVSENNEEALHKIIAGAVGETDGEIELDFRDQWKHFEHASMDRGDTVTVPSYTLDSIAGEYGADIVKIDIEGGERAALNGAQSVLQSAKAIFCEVHPNKIPTTDIQECLDLLARNRDAYIVDENSDELMPLSDQVSDGNNSYVVASYHPDASAQPKCSSRSVSIRS